MNLNKWLAKKIMGWELGYDRTKNPSIPVAYFKDDVYQISYKKWQPTENIEQAFMCVDKYCKENELVHHMICYKGESTLFQLENFYKQGKVVAMAIDLKREKAICRTIYKAREDK